MMSEMKLFQATIVSKNSCYVHTLLVVAENEEKAHDLLCENQGNRFIQYTKKLKQLDIDMTKPQVIEYVGFGENESDCGLDD